MKFQAFFKYLILFSIVPLTVLASNKEEQPKEKKIKTINPVLIEDLEKEVKSQEDIKEAVKKGRGEKGGAKVADPHNFKDVKDNKIKTQNIAGKDDEIDPSKFMPGLGDTPEKKENEEDGKNNKTGVITPNSTQNPFDDKKDIQNISMQNAYAVSEVLNMEGKVGVRLNLGNNLNDNNSFSMQALAELSFYKEFKNSEFRITFSTFNKNTNWINISMREGKEIPAFLKEVYYVKRDENNILNSRIGRFLSPFNDRDYFFSTDLSFDGIDLYGGFKNGIYYSGIFSLLQNDNVFTDDSDISFLGVLNLGFKNNTFDISLNYIGLYGDKLNDVMNDSYSDYNQYLYADMYYTLALKNKNKLIFGISGSYNLTNDEDNKGVAFNIKHENKSLETELTLLYKERNSVINEFTLQKDFFVSDITGGNFTFLYKYDEAVKVGIDFSIGKKISDDNSDLSYITRAVYTIDF